MARIRGRTEHGYKSRPRSTAAGARLVMSFMLLFVLSAAVLPLGGCGFFSQPPVAIIEAQPLVGRPPLTVHFDGGKSFDPDGSITVYQWDLGDGTKANGVTVQHTYSSPGFYQVTLTVKDNSGKRGRDSLIVRNFGFARQDLDVGQQPVAAVAADFNRDGNQDLFVLDLFSNTGTVLLGNGDGSFAASTIRLGDGPSALVAADFDHDGLLDLAITNMIAGTVSLFLGNGNGSFKLLQDLPVGAGPIALTAVDLDHDGNLDLAIVNDFTDDVTLLWGDGTGSFIRGNTLKDERLENIQSITWGDFDRDGNPDLAVIAAESGDVGVFLGNGERDFRGPWLFSVGKGGQVIRRADLNADRKDDLVVVTPDSLAVLLGWGAATQMFKPAATVAGGTGLSWVQIADLDDDGNPDLLAADRATNQVLLLIGHGDGRFEPPVRFTTGTGPSSVLAADLDNDGKLDLVTTDQDENKITVLLNITAY